MSLNLLTGFHMSKWLDADSASVCVFAYKCSLSINLKKKHELRYMSCSAFIIRKHMYIDVVSLAIQSS